MTGDQPDDVANAEGIGGIIQSAVLVRGAGVGDPWSAGMPTAAGTLYPTSSVAVPLKLPVRPSSQVPVSIPCPFYN